MSTIITAIDRHSPAERAGIRVGEQLLTINGHTIVDVLDYRFYGYDPLSRVELKTASGDVRTVTIRKAEGQDLGLNFDTYLMDEMRSCANHCIFCFVDQMPPGMRSTLYFKDDDARLSFLLGNYITLTNLTEREAQRIIDRYNLYPITVVQPQYNLNDRYIEHEIMGTCRKLGIGITTFSPLAQGLLTGKYRKGQPLPAGSRATWQSDHQINDLLTDENLDKVEQLRKVADELGTNLPVLSMAWILQHPEISCVIAGASKPSQLENNMKAAGFVIPADAMAEIDKITGFHRFERHVG